mgnify:CR=1 FL=1
MRLDEQELVIDINQFEFIKKKSTTRGKILATNFNLQDPVEINRILSKILSINFVERLQMYTSNHVFSKKSKELKKSETNLLKNWKAFYEMFDLRHEIVHSDKTSVTLGMKKLELLFENIILFMTASYLVVAFQMDWIVDAKRIESNMKKGNFLSEISDIDSRDIHPELEIKFPRT